jgi:hypothetical protein
MLNEKYLFDDYPLPAGFKFPRHYLELAETISIELRYWDLMFESKEFALRWARILQEQFSDPNLVPFAKSKGSDDVMCFDGADTSGDPKVMVIHTFCEPGWEFRGEYANFSEWLEEVIEAEKAEDEDY